MNTTRRFFLTSMLTAAAIVGGVLSRRTRFVREACAAQPAPGKSLILFYSWSGNTRGIATLISQKTGAAMLELELVKPYSTNYNTCIDEAKRDREQKARPELKTVIPDLSRYDVIYLGHPNWWGTMPMHICTLLEQNDFSGKTIAPFCSHGGGGLGRSVSDIKRISPRATVTDGLSVSSSGGRALSGDIDTWLGRIGLGG